MAAGSPRAAQILADRGWRTRAGSGLTAAQAHQGARPTLDALESMAGSREDVDPALVIHWARAALVGYHRHCLTLSARRL